MVTERDNGIDRYNQRWPEQSPLQGGISTHLLHRPLEKYRNIHGHHLTAIVCFGLIDRRGATVALDVDLPAPFILSLKGWRRRISVSAQDVRRFWPHREHVERAGMNIGSLSESSSRHDVESLVTTVYETASIVEEAT
ncbi:MAG: hypothetical protein D6723_16690 [Acidobacteria bacterium]|nr:MAG: hypothetical protein D6723_16690 [Acidobacteriota bacterium]